MTQPIAVADTILSPGRAFAIPCGAGRRLACLDGALWVTIDSDPRDIVLAAGESLVLDLPRRALLLALGGPARFRLGATAPARIAAGAPALAATVAT
jgi:hypothetical protein